MRGWIIFMLGLLIAGGAVRAEDMKPWHENALRLVKAETKILDATWKSASANVLHAAMKSDGTRRDGFAQYLCMLFSDAGAPKGELKTVFIYDPATYEAYQNGGSGSDIGIAACR